jgi:hypothetical protein
MSTELILLFAASTILLGLIVTLVLFYIDPIKKELKQEQRKREIFEEAYISSLMVDEHGNIQDSDVHDGYSLDSR